MVGLKGFLQSAFEWMAGQKKSATLSEYVNDTVQGVVQARRIEVAKSPRSSWTEDAESDYTDAFNIWKNIVGRGNIFTEKNGVLINVPILRPHDEVLQDCDKLREEHKIHKTRMVICRPNETLEFTPTGNR